MSIYIKNFDLHSEYQTYINGANKVLPNVSYCEDNNEVHYNPYVPHDYSEDYLTLNIISGGTIKWKAKNASCTRTISYSKDNGNTWTNLTSTTSGASFNVNPGDKVLLKGNNATYCETFHDWDNYATYYYSNNLGGTASFNLCGNIMSLINGDDFLNTVSLTSSYTFYELFKQSNVVNAENLILPATTLKESCYSYMFQYCTSLVKAPTILPATTLVSYCYANMFGGCTSLTTAPELPATTLVSGCYREIFYNCPINHIKAMFTTTPSNSYTSNWVYGVSATGTFIKNNAAEWDVTGTNGVPSGWTVEIATN